MLLIGCCWRSRSSLQHFTLPPVSLYIQLYAVRLSSIQLAQCWQQQQQQWSGWHCRRQCLPFRFRAEQCTADAPCLYSARDCFEQCFLPVVGIYSLPPVEQMNWKGWYEEELIKGQERRAMRGQLLFFCNSGSKSYSLSGTLNIHGPQMGIF